MGNVVKFNRLVNRVDGCILDLSEFTCDLLADHEGSTDANVIELEDRFDGIMNRLHHITDQLIEQDWLQ